MPPATTTSCRPHARRHRTGRPAAALALTAALGLTLAGCGNKEPPRPPVRLIPAPTTDLEISQRGLEFQFALSYPATTTSGDVLPGLKAIELWRMAKPLRPAEEETTAAAEETPPSEAEAAPDAAEAAEPEAGEAAEPPPSPFLLRRPDSAEPAAEDQVQVEPREFAALAALALRIEGPELDAAVSGNRVLLRLPLAMPPVSEEEAEVLVWAVQSVSSEDLVSGFSNLVKILPRQPPAAPSRLTLRPSDEGIEVGWHAEEPALGFRLYRRDADSRLYAEAVAQPAAESRTHLDAAVSFGSRYVYAVTAVARQAPLLESALSSEHEVDYQDRYPPPPPAGLVILAEPGRVRLLWDASEADDLAGYRVYRRPAEDTGYLALNEQPILELEYLDTDVASGRGYSYYVTAVDRSGNESEAGETADAEVP